MAAGPAGCVRVRQPSLPPPPLPPDRIGPVALPTRRDQTRCGKACLITSRRPLFSAQCSPASHADSAPSAINDDLRGGTRNISDGRREPGYFFFASTVRSACDSTLYLDERLR